MSSPDAPSLNTSLTFFDLRGDDFLHAHDDSDRCGGLHVGGNRQFRAVSFAAGESGQRAQRERRNQARAKRTCTNDAPDHPLFRRHTLSPKRVRQFVDR